MSVVVSKIIFWINRSTTKNKLVNIILVTCPVNVNRGGVCLYDAHPALRRRAGSLSFKVGKGIGFRLPNLDYFTHFPNELTALFSN